MSECRSKHQKAIVLELHNLSQSRKTCFCLQGSKKLGYAFGPWNGNCEEALDVSEKDRRNNYHICGGYLLDSKAPPNRNPPKALHPKCSKNLPFSVGYRNTNYRRGCVEKDFVAFQHLDSHLDYAKLYRTSKYRHICIGSVVTVPNEEPQPSDNPLKSGVHTKNFWTIKYDQKYMEDCCKPTLAESFKINPYAAPRSSAHPHQTLHSYKGNTTTSTHEHKSFYAKTSQNPIFSPSCEEPMELDTVELWMPKNAVLHHRNSSALGHHFNGYFTRYDRPSHSQQTSREFLALGRAPPRVRFSSQVFISHPGKPDGTLQALQNWSKEELRQQHQIYLDQHYQFRPCADHSKFYPGNVKGNYMHTDLKSQESVTTRSPFLSKATLFPSSENSTNTKELLRGPGTTCPDSSSQVRFPKLPDKFLDRNLMQGSSVPFPDASSKQDLLTSKTVMKGHFSSSTSTAKFLCGTSEEKEEMSSSTSTAQLKSNDDDGSNSRCRLEFNGGLCLKMPKKWEDEYLDHIPRKISAIFPQPQRLFSLESVNKRLLEHGIVMEVKDKERTAHLHSKHEKSLEEDKHQLDEIEGVFGTLQVVKQEIRKRVRKRERNKHKEKKRPKVTTGQSGPSTASNMPQQCAYRSKLDQSGVFTDESRPAELCYGE